MELDAVAQSKTRWDRLAKALDANAEKLDHIHYLAFDAAGSKGFLYVGVLQVWEALLSPKPLREHIRGASGVSAGALAALCVALGLPPESLYCAYLKMMDVQNHKMAVSNLFTGKHAGMVSSDALEASVASLLYDARVAYDATFSDMYFKHSNHFQLYISAYDQASQTPKFYGWNTSPRKRVLDAVVESMCVPLLFIPRTYGAPTIPSPASSKSSKSSKSSNSSKSCKTARGHASPQCSNVGPFSPAPTTPRGARGEFIDGWFAGLYLDEFDMDATMIVNNVTDAAARALGVCVGDDDDDCDQESECATSGCDDTETEGDIGKNTHACGKDCLPVCGESDAVDKDNTEYDDEDDGGGASLLGHGIFSSFMKMYVALQLRMTRLMHAQLSPKARENKIDIVWNENFLTAGNTRLKRDAMLRAGGMALLQKCASPETLLGRMASIMAFSNKPTQ